MSNSYLKFLSESLYFLIPERYCEIIFKEGSLDKIEEHSQTSLNASLSNNFDEKIKELANIVKETVMSNK